MTDYKTVHLFCHTGLGDMLVMEGLVRHFATFSRRVYVNTEYPEEVRRLYSQVPVEPLHVGRSYPTRPQIKLPEQIDQTIYFGYYSDEFQKLGPRTPGRFESLTFDSHGWDREFYRQANLPFLLRWKNTHLPVPKEEFKLKGATDILVHDEHKHRIKIEDSECVRIRPVPGRSIFEWMWHIAKAREVHCIDSSVMNLVESMWANGYLSSGAKLFYHRDVRPTYGPTLMAPWRIVENEVHP